MEYHKILQYSVKKPILNISLRNSSINPFPSFSNLIFLLFSRSVIRDSKHEFDSRERSFFSRSSGKKERKKEREKQGGTRFFTRMKYRNETSDWKEKKNKKEGRNMEIRWPYASSVTIGEMSRGNPGWATNSSQPKSNRLPPRFKLTLEPGLASPCLIEFRINCFCSSLIPLLSPSLSFLLFFLSFFCPPPDESVSVIAFLPVDVSKDAATLISSMGHGIAMEISRSNQSSDFLVSFANVSISFVRNIYTLQRV